MAETASCLPPADEFAFQQSSPLSPRDSYSSPPAPPLNVDDYHQFEASVEEGRIQVPFDDRRNSTHSSISSFPASVLHHDAVEELRTPSRPHLLHLSRHGSAGSLSGDTTPSRRRGYGAAFRNPSSVRAMQMKDELEDDDDSQSITPHRRNGSQLSIRSHGSAYSAHSSLSKRVGRSSQSSPLKGSSKLKKEFPLVLLHCSLLPPASGTLTAQCDAEVFGAVLPEEYRKRWTTLQERLRMPEIQARGILIPHPQEDYELLEERLLESLELEKPRILSNHFLPHETSGGDSGFESGSQTENESEAESNHGFTCPDCGKSVNLNVSQKWEVKVYAANGLMRAGAWGAAWREMEKVDIEIGLWLPDDVRQEVAARLEALKAANHDMGAPNQDPYNEYEDSRDREVYGGEDHASHHETNTGDPKTAFNRCDDQQNAYNAAIGQWSRVQFNATSVLRDPKTLAILLLSIIIMYLTTSASGQGSSISVTKSTKVSSVLPEVTTVTSTTFLTATMAVTNESNALPTVSTTEVTSSSQTTHSQSMSGPLSANSEGENSPVADGGSGPPHDFSGEMRQDLDHAQYGLPAN